MSASLNDIDLRIIWGGRPSFWQGVKSCGNVIWDLRLGLFRSPPVPDDSWIEASWSDAMASRGTPLENPVYGITHIDFDKKLITDDNGYGVADQLAVDWFRRSILFPESNPVVPLGSLREHLARGRVFLANADFHTARPTGERVLLPAEPGEAQQVVFDLVRDFERFRLPFVWLALPDGWRLVCDRGEN